MGIAKRIDGKYNNETEEIECIGGKSVFEN